MYVQTDMSLKGIYGIISTEKQEIIDAFKHLFTIDDIAPCYVNHKEEILGIGIITTYKVTCILEYKGIPVRTFLEEN